MFAVGSRVGTLFAQSITQSIYTVSGPFHPFGGAVDIIVVEQEDGSFKSSPWYVKFGKFQGVLKRREKKVVVSVNDVEANFHMFLDHKGEAYFLKDDISDDSPLAIEDSAVPSPNEATSSAGENSVEPLDTNDFGCKQEEREDARADADNDNDKDKGKEETEDDGGDAVELMLEERTSSAAQVLQQAVCDGESAAESIVDVTFSDQVPWCALAAARENAGLFSPRFAHSSSDVSTVDGEGENHAFENPSGRLEGSGGSSDSSSFFADASLDACCGDVESSGENQEPNSESFSGGENLIHGLLNEAVRFRELSCPEPSTAVLASAAFESLRRVVADTVPVPAKDAVSEKVELPEEEVAATDELRVVNESTEACSSQKVSFSYVEKRSSYTDVCSTDLETKTTGGTVIHALLNRTVSQNSSQSTVLVANAALEALTAASLPEIAASTETQVSDMEPSGRVRRFQELLNKAIGLQESTRSAPANALIATAVLKSLTNVVSDVLPAISPSDSCAEPRLVETSEEDAAKESEESRATASAEEAGSSVRETGETAIVPVPPAEETSNEKLVVLVGGRQYPWTAPVVLGLLAFGQFRFAPAPSLPTTSGQQAIVVASGQSARSTLSGAPSSGWRLWPFGRSARTPEQVDASALLSGDNDALKRATSRITNEYIRRNGFYKKPRKVRSNCPSSQQLASLNLKEGANKITFTFVTRVLGKQQIVKVQVDARIYLWKWNTRIVISDVDGTITRSDVLGQVMPLVGKDWTQSGVAKLFSAIKRNGYELMFLSARAISQAHITRNFLEGIKQDGQQLPDGPVVISPDGLFPSLYREVIRRAPHEFKIACLEVIKSLFPPDCKPFYAGFGNRDTDEFSYLKVGISKGKIFIINPKGEVMVNNQVDVKSYTSLHPLVHDMFPAVAFTEEEDYNEWNFWKLPLPDIEEESVKSTGSSSSKKGSFR